jgi:hypothetical protein
MVSETVRKIEGILTETMDLQRVLCEADMCRMRSSLLLQG